MREDGNSCRTECRNDAEGLLTTVVSIVVAVALVLKLGPAMQMAAIKEDETSKGAGCC